MVWPQASNIQIFKPVVIVVTDCDSHTKSNIAYPSLVCYIREAVIAIIMIESAPGFLMRFGEIHSQGIYKVNVQVAIVVVIKQGNTTAHRFCDVFLFR